MAHRQHGFERLAVSDLDAWHYFQSSDQSAEDFMARMDGRDPPSRAARLGTEFHLCWEELAARRRRLKGRHPSRGPDSAWLFDDPGINIRQTRTMQAEGGGTEFHLIALDQHGCISGLRNSDVEEVECARAYEVDGQTIRLRGRVDALCGTQGVDWKLTFRPIDLEKYVNAWQWRAYMALADELESFEYRVFRGKDNGGSVAITEFRAIEFHRYERLEADVEDAVSGLSRWLARQGWEGRPAHEQD